MQVARAAAMGRYPEASGRTRRCSASGRVAASIRRWVPLAPPNIEALAAHKAAQELERAEFGFDVRPAGLRPDRWSCPAAQRGPSPWRCWVNFLRESTTFQGRQPCRSSAFAGAPAERASSGAVLSRAGLPRLSRSDSVRSHHLVVLVFDDVAVPDELSGVGEAHA